MGPARVEPARELVELALAPVQVVQERVEPARELVELALAPGVERGPAALGLGQVAQGPERMEQGLVLGRAERERMEQERGLGRVEQERERVGLALVQERGRGQVGPAQEPGLEPVEPARMVHQAQLRSFGW